ncbi:hypothetical protein WG902_16555 [Ramlibacter sp. PS3R-8]|uniref:hypothetical protein n=1 Tax=Ramlibacter sp. PS3R-8 TaxID=3133437 RepID=UPI00309F04D7
MTRKSSRAAPRGEHIPSASQASLPTETDPADPSTGKKPHDAIAPRAGRTGGLGTRAERPSEGRKQPVETTHQDPGGRRGKAPSASVDARERVTPARNR